MRGVFANRSLLGTECIGNTVRASSETVADSERKDHDITTAIYLDRFMRHRVVVEPKCPLTSSKGCMPREQSNNEAKAAGKDETGCGNVIGE